MGRFFTIDPWAEKYNFQSTYLYAYNNPIRFTDFQGLGGIDEVKVTFKPGVSDTKVHNYSITYLQKIGAAAGVNEVRVGSTYRSPENQINLMYKQTKELGVKAQKELYGSKGDKVIDAYATASGKKGSTEESVKAAMTSTAETEGFISDHSSSNYENNNAIDVTRSDFTAEQIETIKAEFSNIDSDVKLIDEPDRNCLHFVIPNKEVTYSGGTVGEATVTGNGQTLTKLTPVTPDLLK